MSTAKRTGPRRYLRRPPAPATTGLRASLRTGPVLIRTVAFMPAYLRRRPH